MWNLPPPPGFTGLDVNRPMRFYERHLPHWRQEGATYFVTFRQADALPQPKLRELAALRQQWDAKVGQSSALSEENTRRSSAPSYDPTRQSSALSYDPTRRSSALSYDEARRSSALSYRERRAKATMEKVEHWLDEGMGSCVLRDSSAAQAVERCLRHEDGKRFDLLAFVIMPNHVHLLARPYSDATFPLERLEQAWKSYSAREINAQRGTSGAFWQDESFDRIVRDEEHLFRCLQYIGSNPRRANLRIGEYRRFVRLDWQQAGWGFQDL